MRIVQLLLLLAAGLLEARGTLPVLEGLHQRFEFQYSFKPPFVANDKGQIPFWEHGGDSLATEEQVRVCPSLHDRSGWVWGKERFTHSSWMMDVTLKVSGRGRVGADGLALWFTADKGGIGPVFGNVVDWRGVGVVLDSFDNDGKNDNPKIQVFLSDGSLKIDHSQDGLGQDSGSCQRDFRNRRLPVKIRVTYIDKTLEVWVHDGISDLPDAYELCVRVEHVSTIPGEGYFGISAATGGLSDDHDVLSFVVHSLTSQKEQTQRMIEKLEQQRMDELSQEYDKLSKTFQDRRDEYAKQHPTPESPVEAWESNVELEQDVKMVYSMQSSLMREVKALSASMDKLLAGGQAVDKRAGGTPNTYGDLHAMEGRLNHHLSEMRAQLERSAPAGQLTASEQLQPLYEMKNKLQEMASKIDQLQENQSQPCPSSSSSSCLSTWFFMAVVLLQTAAVLGLIMFNYRQERNAKKFF